MFIFFVSSKKWLNDYSTISAVALHVKIFSVTSSRLLLPADQKPNEKWTFIAKFSGVPSKVTLSIGINWRLHVSNPKFVNLVREVMVASVFYMIFRLACILVEVLWLQSEAYPTYM